MIAPLYRIGDVIVVNSTVILQGQSLDTQMQGVVVSAFLFLDGDGFNPAQWMYQIATDGSVLSNKYFVESDIIPMPWNR